MEKKPKPNAVIEIKTNKVSLKTAQITQTKASSANNVLIGIVSSIGFTKPALNYMDQNGLAHGVVNESEFSNVSNEKKETER